MKVYRSNELGGEIPYLDFKVKSSLVFWKKHNACASFPPPPFFFFGFEIDGRTVTGSISKLMLGSKVSRVDTLNLLKVTIYRAASHDHEFLGIFSKIPRSLSAGFVARQTSSVKG